MEYRIVFLTHGQQAPEGSTGVGLSNGGIVWAGASGTFPTEVLTGTFLPDDTEIVTPYNHRVMTEDELYEYNNPTTYSGVI